VGKKRPDPAASQRKTADFAQDRESKPILCLCGHMPDSRPWRGAMRAWCAPLTDTVNSSGKSSGAGGPDHHDDGIARSVQMSIEDLWL
jgi:hypothetical protein